MWLAERLEAEVIAEYPQLGTALSPQGRYVQLIGHPCSGKTTAIEALTITGKWARAYNDAFSRVQRFSKYHTSLLVDRDPHNYLAFQIEGLLVRHLQTIGLSERDICDQSHFSILAYSRLLLERGQLSNAHYQSFFANFLYFNKLSPLPRVMVRFRCDGPIARERLVARGREHEQNVYTTDFLEHLDQSYSHALRYLPDGVPRKLIDTTGLSTEKAAASLLEALNET